jgi:hypothetical protein
LSGRFVKGQSGNPSGRPKARRPNISAFDIIFDKTLTATQNGVERKLTVDEALQHQTYQAALKGSSMAVRKILKMIEKREVALRKRSSEPITKPTPIRVEYDSDSADEAMKLLNIISRNPQWPDGHGPRPNVIETWAAQAAISRPGRAKLQDRRRQNLNLYVKDYSKLRWPRGSST